MFSRILLFGSFLALMACNKNETADLPNGFSIEGKFYPTPYGSYSKSGTSKDFIFDFYDKEIVKNSSGGYDFIDIENKTLNYFSVSDLTLETQNHFPGTFFYDNSRTLPFGIDDFYYSAALPFDFYGQAVDPPQFVTTGGTFIIKSKVGQVFDIEYEATFDNKITLKGNWKGELSFRD